MMSSFSDLVDSYFNSRMPPQTGKLPAPLINSTVLFVVGAPSHVTLYTPSHITRSTRPHTPSHITLSTRPHTSHSLHALTHHTLHALTHHTLYTHLQDPDSTTDFLDQFQRDLYQFTKFSCLQELASLQYSDTSGSSCAIVSSLEFDCDGEMFAVAGVTKRIKVSLPAVDAGAYMASVKAWLTISMMLELTWLTM